MIRQNRGGIGGIVSHSVPHEPDNVGAPFPRDAIPGGFLDRSHADLAASVLTFNRIKDDLYETRATGTSLFI